MPAMLHEWLADHLTPEMAESSVSIVEKKDDPTHRGVSGSTGQDSLSSRSIRCGRPIAWRPDADIKNEIVAVITQRRRVTVDPNGKADPNNPKSEDEFWFRGGCTLIIDPDNDDEPIRYAISKRRHERGAGSSASANSWARARG